jgi:hypothetical protein
MEKGGGLNFECKYLRPKVAYGSELAKINSTARFMAHRAINFSIAAAGENGRGTELERRVYLYDSGKALPTLVEKWRSVPL